MTDVTTSYYWTEELANGKIKFFVVPSIGKYFAEATSKGQFGERFVPLCPTLYVSAFAVSPTCATEIAANLAKYSKNFAAPAPERAAEGMALVATHEAAQAAAAETARLAKIAAQTLARDGGPATERQLAYLNILGVVIPPGEHLGKNGASAIIDATKRGEGVGMFGLFFSDGSN